MELAHWRSKQLNETKKGFHYAAIFFFGCSITSSVFIGENAAPVVILSLLTLFCVLCGEKIKRHIESIEYHNKQAVDDQSYRDDTERLSRFQLSEILLPSWFWDQEVKRSVFEKMSQKEVGLSKLGKESVQLMIEKASSEDRAQMRADSEASLSIAQGIVGRRAFSKEEMEAIYMAIEIISRLEAIENLAQGWGATNYNDTFLTRRRNDLLRKYLGN